MKDTLVIVGSHPRTRGQFDFDRTDCDIWLFNEAVSNKDNTWAKRADAIFQMHVPAIWRNPQNRNDPGHYAWLQSQTEVPNIYMQDEYEEVPNSVRYPLAEILRMVHDRKDHFLTSSVPQAMALAAYLKQWKRVEIYGVAMETQTEWQFQREGVAYWRGYLEGQGVDVYFADPTFEAPLYGYEGEVSIKYERFQERIEQLAPEIQKQTAEYMAASVAVDKNLTIFCENGGEKNAQVLMQSVGRLRDLAESLGVLDGARQENERYKGKADEMRKASEGEFIFSRQEFESAAKNLQDRAGRAVTEMTVAATQLSNIHNMVSGAAKGSPKRLKITENYRHMMRQMINAINQAAVYKGASQENFEYMSYLDKHIRAAGGAKSEQVMLEVMKAGSNA